MSQVIGKLCSIHYVDGHTCRQERTRTYDVWAWSINPSGIAKEVWLTITDPDEFPSSDFQVHHSAPTGLKFGLSYKLLIHVDVVEDLSFIEGRNIQDRKRRREFEWNYGVPDSLGEKREKVVYQDAGRKGRYHRRDEDREDPGRGGRHLRSRSWWDGRGSHCRGAVDDCYSNNNKHLFRGSSSYRSRDLSQNSWGHGSWLSNQVAAVKPQHMGTYSLKSSSIGKNVSFASPIATVLGAANTGDLRGPSVFISNTPSTVSCAFHDPMLDEALLSSGVVGGHNSSVMCWELQNSVAREGSAASPPTMMEVDGSDKRTNTAVPEPSLLPSELVQHFDQPLSKGKIKAIKTLLENGKQLKKKVRGSKVVPAVLACPTALV